MSQYGQGGSADQSGGQRDGQGGWQGGGQDGQPNPFSRDGANGAGAPDHGQEWPGYGASAPEPTRPYESGVEGQQHEAQGYPTNPYGQAQPSAPDPYASSNPSYGYAQPDPQPYGSTAPDPYAGYPPNPYEADPYAANPYAASPYQASPYSGGYVSPYGAMPVQHPQAVTAMVLGIVGMVVCPPVGIGGLVMGNRIRREIDAEPARYSGKGMATAGFVLGICSSVYLAFLVLAVIAGIAGSAGSY